MAELYLRVDAHPRPYSTSVGRGGQVYYNKLCRTYQRAVIDQVAEQLPDGWEPFHEAVDVTYHFYLPRPKSHYRTGRFADELRPDAPTHHLVPPDGSKLLRITEDGLTHAGVWDDDALCSPVQYRKSWTSRPGSEGGVIIEVRD